MLIRFLMLLALCSCNTDYLVDSRLKTHVDKFYSLSDGDLQRDNLVVSVKRDLFKNEGCIGRAIINQGFLHLWDGQIIVQIDEEYNETKEYLMIETAVFHELGHALLCRDHADQIPSLMSATGEYSGYRRKWNDPATYSDDLRDKLRHELFNPK